MGFIASTPFWHWSYRCFLSWVPAPDPASTYIAILVEHDESKTQNPHALSGFAVKLETMFNLICYMYEFISPQVCKA